jgi:Skp family chaperone for outer membrane proteins
MRQVMDTLVDHYNSPRLGAWAGGMVAHAHKLLRASVDLDAALNPHDEGAQMLQQALDQAEAEADAEWDAKEAEAARAAEAAAEEDVASSDLRERLARVAQRRPA